MNVKRNIITIVVLALWVGLLVALYIMSPISELSVGVVPPAADIVFSACFCVVGIAGSVVGFLISSKTLILMSALNSVMQIFSILMFCLYCFCFRRGILAMALYFANPFSAMLLTPGIVIIYDIHRAVSRTPDSFDYPTESESKKENKAKD